MFPDASCPPEDSTLTLFLSLSFPAFKQSPQGIPALGTGIKKRRHGEEEMYYVPVSVGELRWLRAGLGTAVASFPLRETLWGGDGGQDGAARSAAGQRARGPSRDLETRSKSICGCTCPRQPWPQGHRTLRGRVEKKGPRGRWPGGTGTKRSPGLLVLPSSRCEAGRTSRS